MTLIALDGSARDEYGSARDEFATVVLLTKKPSTSISGGSSLLSNIFLLITSLINQIVNE